MRPSAFLMVLRRSAGLASSRVDEDGAEVVDVGERRSGADEITDRVEIAVAVVGCEATARIDALGTAAQQSVRRDDGAGGILATARLLGQSLGAAMDT